MPKDKKKDLNFRQKISAAFNGGDDKDKRMSLSERLKKRRKASEELSGRGRRK